MAEVLSKKATVKNICGSNPVMIHPIGGTRTLRTGESFTGLFTIGEITAMDNSEQYDVTSAAEHKSAEPQTDDDNTPKLTAAEKKAAKAAETPAGVLPAAPVLPTAPAALPSALQLPGSGN